MKYDYLFVINPISGGNDKTEIKELIKDYSGTHGFGYEIYETTGTEDARRIGQLLIRDEPEVVVAVGGDGTIQLLLPLLKHTPFLLGVIPAGSANGMAAEMEIPSDAEDALEVILEGHTHQFDLLRVNNQHDCLHIGDLGFNARLVHHFEKNNTRGLTGYAMQFFREFKNPKPYQMTLTFDGKIREVCTYMIAFANARKYGTGATLNPKGKPNDGIFEICLIKDISVRSFFDWVITVNDFNPDYIEIFSCKEIKIHTQEPAYLQVDGEVLGKHQNVKIEIQPRCITIITPEDYQID